jgi:PiT family inorganic phosphate transporter
MDLSPAFFIVPTIAFAFMNGANDSGTMAASVVSSRALSPRSAAVWAALGAFVGALLLGSAVAKTLGESLVHLNEIPPQAEPHQACIAAASAAVLWGTVAWKFGWPGSYTHSLLGGWIGGFVALGGPDVVQWNAAAWVLAGVLFTPVISLFASWVAMRLFFKLGSELSMQTKWLFRGAERLLFGALCVAHGANAAQKSMALLVLAGLSYGQAWPWPEEILLPMWVRMVCATAFAAGVLLGFTTTLIKVGFGIFRVDTIHSFTALGVSGGLILVSTLMGLPLSAGQINSSALLGTGAGDRARQVRWDAALGIFSNWALTFPVSAVMAYFLTKVLS